MPKILVVDDDVTVTELLKVLLTIEGHQPTVVNDSSQTLDIASSLSPDLITLDLMMPGLTGFEVCELLHHDPGLATIPVVIVSARDDPESMDRAMQAGANAYITKPFNADDLMGKIKELTSP